MQEIWRDIKDYEGLYQVSSMGRVKSLNYNHTNKEKVLKNVEHHTGYVVIGLVKNKKKKSFSVHKLVAEAFIPNPNNYLCVNHKDENKANNCVDNLEWCTHKYNANYGTRTNRISKNESIKINQYDLAGNYIKTWNSMTEIAKTLNVCISGICLCCKGIYKTSNGYIWKYANK